MAFKPAELAIAIARQAFGIAAGYFHRRRVRLVARMPRPRRDIRPVASRSVNAGALTGVLQDPKAPVGFCFPSVALAELGCSRLIRPAYPSDRPDGYRNV